MSITLRLIQGHRFAAKHLANAEEELLQELQPVLDQLLDRRDTLERIECHEDVGIRIHVRDYDNAPDTYTLTAEDLAANDPYSAYTIRQQAKANATILSDRENALQTAERNLRHLLEYATPERRAAMIESLKAKS